MRTGLLLLAIAAGVALRVAALAWHDLPRGDVLLDTGVARSLGQMEGFRSGFTRGTAFVRGDGPPPAQDLADQHAPLWPLLGAALAPPAGGPFAGLQLGSLLAGLLLLALVWRAADRLVEGVPGHPQGLPALATALVATSFLMIEFSANGALYMAQACLVLMLAEALARPRPSWLAPGLVLGCAWLLSHQAAVLLPVPALVLAGCAPPGRRVAGAWRGLLASAVACACVLPWWVRNQLAFGDPFHSTNSYYPMHLSGIEPALSIEGGLPVGRFPDVSLGGVLARGARAWLPGNVLYAALAALLVWPGIVALAGSGLPRLAAAARAGADRRLATLLLAGAALLAIALAWPGLKLRYLVALAPVVVLLGVRAFAQPPSTGERRAAWLLAAGWLALVLGTLDDLGGERHARWLAVAFGGPVLLLLPLLLRHVRVRAVGVGLHVALVTGALVQPLLGLAALLPPPHTSYHGSGLLPDIFGQPKDRLEDIELRTLDLARREALRDGAQVVCGPEGLLAFGEPGLVTLPYSGRDWPDGPLAALVDAGRCDHVITLAGSPGYPVGLSVGEAWLDGRLEVVSTVTLEEDGQLVGAATVSRVRR
jgi:hypothetical protein